ncbi:hypothetical protein BDM02DRAFT_3260876 [Thelephora ganbajun]|uniref:Uncharacterized protein n=1 Tax=Thelephora ganbajun TaxID=370292 RepID=A0ACB6ZGI7_THEGA|nr:hypothetical protein BDM02DRAFT_3260876 [Thelephora ganbajun]
MPEIDPTRYSEVPRKFLDIYIEQLFGHNGAKKIAIKENIEPYDWVKQTRDSYELWLSYAMLELLSKRRLKVKDDEPTPHTEVHKKFLDNASQECIDAYVDWAFPPSKAEVWRKHFKGGYMRYFVSPVHFWFFMSCRQKPPSRPLVPKTCDDLFRHPLLRIAGYTGPASFVVPEYFTRDDAEFDGLTDLKSTSYYIFPHFGQKLFEYANQETFLGSFTAFYITHEAAWFVTAGSDDIRRFIVPHPALKRHWRWAEVLQMLDSSKDSGKGGRPPWCRLAPPRYHEAEQIARYLDIFGMMAKQWVELGQIRLSGQEHAKQSS